MCSGPDKSNPNSSTTQGAATNSNNMKDMSQLSVETDDSFSSLLEFAANNDVEALKQSIQFDLSGVDEPGLWYVRKKGSNQIVKEERTPLMVAATYGSVDVIRLIVALPEVDLNKSCGSDNWTALHCAASGGSVKTFDAIKLLLSAGADPNVEDINGKRPIDVIISPPKVNGSRAALEEILTHNLSDGAIGECNLRVSTYSSDESDSLSSPSVHKLTETPANSISEKKQYPVDPSLPDIRNSIYSTDEFRMYSFKVRPCSRAYSHDWTECPFVHPGENARRRDPRKFHYSCVPCPDFRKGACRRGDMCEYAHGVFECWLHPAQYRTRLCKDGTSCGRQVCFFAHTQEELRPLYVSTGSGVPSPRSGASAPPPTFMDMAAALAFMPGSPSGFSLSPTQGNGMGHGNGAWPQPNVPTLTLPGSNLQSSRLRSSLSARDIPPEDLNMLQDLDAQQMVLNDFGCFSSARNNLNRSARPKTTLTPSNLEELFMAEIASSPRYGDQGGGVFSPTHKSAFFNQFQQQQQHQQQQQSLLSPINTNVFSPRNIEQHSLMQAPIGVSSPRMMSPRSLESASPMSTRLSAFAHRETQQQQIQQMRSLSSRDLGSNPNYHPSNYGSPPVAAPNWSKWGSPNGKVDWSVNRGDDRVFPKNSSQFDLKNDGDEPDLSWVQSLVKESPPEMMEKQMPPVVAASGSGAWLEQMQIDHQLVA